MSINDALVMTCKHVLQGRREIGIIVHHSDDTWQITCGEPDHATEDDVEVVHAVHLFENHDWLTALMPTIDKGRLADRTASGWEITAHDD